ncbi:tryptophan synthase subunit alpha [Sphingomicrobium nitratireducens]|uniref:tryptophan synthase subunit alpha n=1 Tax=Sphingomicrobium nitratireducens TaxID=2964666 RepID=UPI0022402E31|nr:tryptophan synthase subunit alpha [Sphingomicrobium nitratireducens]
MTRRYDAMFAACREEGRGAFGAFLMIGDPDLGASEAMIEAAIAGGADMLELGIPFSDPVADGPVIQAAACRALGAGTTPSKCLEVIATIRARHPDIPIGILTYANIAVARGVGQFAGELAKAGVDSLLLADIPSLEAAPFAAAIRAAGIAPVLIAAPNTPDQALAAIARLAGGYTYCVARKGVTGAKDDMELDHTRLFERLAALGAPPPVLGFGIGTAAQVRASLDAGAAGVISGSAIVAAAAKSGDHAVAVERVVEDLASATKSKRAPRQAQACAN